MNTPAPVVQKAAPPPSIPDDPDIDPATGKPRIKTPAAPAAAAPPQGKPLAATSGETITPPAGAGASAVSDADVGTEKRERLWDVLTAKRTGVAQITDDNQKKLTFFNRNILNDLSCVQNKSGMLTVFNPDGTKPMLDMAPGGAVGIRKNWDLNKPAELASTDHIDALLKGSALARMSMGAAGATLTTPNDNSRAMMEKAALLSGLTVSNPKYANKADLDAALEKIEPGLAKKMEQQWQGMKNKYEPEAFSPTPIKQPAPAAAAPAAPAAKAATQVTADNIKTLETSGKPVVLLVYDPHDPNSQQKIDKLAAAAGDKVNVVKMDVNQMHDLAATLPANDPLRQKLEGNATTQSANLIVLDSKGQVAAAQQAIPPDLQKWVEQDVLRANVFPPPAAAVPGAPAPAVAAPAAK